MAKELRQQVLDLIDTNLSTGSNITALEHRAVEQAIVNYIGFDMVAYGKIGPIDITGTQTSYTTTGNLLSAIKTNQFERFQRILVTIPNNLLTSTDFKVRLDIESAGVDNLDNDMLGFLFRKDGSSTNTFYIILEEIDQVTQSIYIHTEVVQLRDI
jgi:hypothetical protein